MVQCRTESTHTGKAMEQIRLLSQDDKEELRRCAALVSDYSWGHDYPVNPFEEMCSAECSWAAYISGELAGCVIISRFASPDGVDNGEFWFADAVIIPKYRGSGTFTRLYHTAMEWVKDTSGRVLSCTDNPVMDAFFLKNDWHKIRDTKDEQGNTCRVYELSRR